MPEIPAPRIGADGYVPPALAPGMRVAVGGRYGHGPYTVCTVVPLADDPDGAVFVGLAAPPVHDDARGGFGHVNRARLVDGVWRGDHDAPLVIGEAFDPTAAAPLDVDELWAARVHKGVTTVAALQAEQPDLFAEVG